MKGRRVLDRIEGFKMYLSVAEKERLEFLHPPEEMPELFEKYLPYAMAMGVENQWSEHFASVHTGAAQAAEGGYRPTWYSGHSFHSHGVSGFGDKLGNSLSSALNTSSSAPGSSGGGGGGF